MESFKKCYVLCQPALPRFNTAISFELRVLNNIAETILMHITTIDRDILVKFMVSMM